MKAKIKNKSALPKNIKGVKFGPREEKVEEFDEEVYDIAKEDIHFKTESLEVKAKPSKKAKKSKATKEEDKEEKKDEFECEECGEAFSTEKGLKLHETKSHGGE